jgi:hypothetical protein
MADDLQTAIDLVKAGKKSEGGKILSELVKVNPNNEFAWQWLSVCVLSEKEKQYCLNQVLRINPQNEYAKNTLEKIKPPQLAESPIGSNAAILELLQKQNEILEKINTVLVYSAELEKEKTYNWRARIVDVNMSIWTMAMFMIKWFIASIPVAIIIGVITLGIFFLLSILGLSSLTR